MDSTSNNFLIITLFFFSAGCSKQIVGHYTSKTKLDVIYFEGKELTLLDDGTFKLNEWTDSYGIILDKNNEFECTNPKGKGYGNYQIQGDSLALVFKNVDYVTYSTKVLDTADQYFIETNLIDELEHPLMGETITILDIDKKIIQGDIFDEFGNSKLSIDKEKIPTWIQVGVFGSRSKKINIKESLGESQHYLKRCVGYFAEGESIKLWFKTKSNFIEYIKDGKKVKLRRANSGL